MFGSSHAAFYPRVGGGAVRFFASLCSGYPEAGVESVTDEPPPKRAWTGPPLEFGWTPSLGCPLSERSPCGERCYNQRCYNQRSSIPALLLLWVLKRTCRRLTNISRWWWWGLGMPDAKPRWRRLA